MAGREQKGESRKNFQIIKRVRAKRDLRCHPILGPEGQGLPGTRIHVSDLQRGEAVFFCPCHFTRPPGAPQDRDFAQPGKEKGQVKAATCPGVALRSLGLGTDVALRLDAFLGDRTRPHVAPNTTLRHPTARQEKP